MAVGAAKFFGQLNHFVEHHAPWHIHAVHQLVSADPHAGMLDGGELFQLAIKLGQDQSVQIVFNFNAAVQQRVVMGGIALVKAGQITREHVDGGCAVAAYQVLVECLQSKFARASACRFRGGFARAGAGQAGASAILELRANKYEGKIILVGDETHLPYERPPLSKDVILKPEETKIEILSEEKLKISPRRKALEKLKNYLKK